MDFVEILVPLGFFLMVYGIIFLFVRRKERLALIEKDTDASIFYSRSNGSASLKYGILLIGLSVGLFLGNILDKYTSLNEGVSYFSMLLLFGGLSLLVYYFVARKNNTETF